MTRTRRHITPALVALAAAVSAGCTDELPPLDTAYGEITFTAPHMVAEGYWFSRYNLSEYLMKSSAGTTFNLEERFPGLIDYMVQTSSDDLSTSWYPSEGWELLEVPAAEGDPHYAGPSDGNSATWTDQAWTSHSEGSTLETLAFTAMKESMWARQFHVDEHFGIPGENDIPGANQRFFAGPLIVEEAVQLKYYVDHKDEFGSDVGGYYALLAAVSDIANVASVSHLEHSETNRLSDYLKYIEGDLFGSGTTAEQWLADLATELYTNRPAEIGTVREHALAIFGLEFYGMYSGDQSVKDEIASLADALAAADKTDLYDNAMALRSLVGAYLVTEDTAYKSAAEDSMSWMVDDYDVEHNVFTSQTVYDTETMAAIFGALNAASLYLDNTVADPIMVSAFENLIDISGFQQAEPGIDTIADYEQLPSADNVDALFHRYPPHPEPYDGDGTYGIAPVVADSVTWDPGTASWTAIDRNFTAGAAFHLANEMIWFHSDEVNGFPTF